MVKTMTRNPSRRKTVATTNDISNPQRNAIQLERPFSYPRRAACRPLTACRIGAANLPAKVDTGRIWPRCPTSKLSLLDERTDSRAACLLPLAASAESLQHHHRRPSPAVVRISRYIGYAAFFDHGRIVTYIPTGGRYVPLASGLCDRRQSHY